MRTLRSDIELLDDVEKFDEDADKYGRHALQPGRHASDGLRSDEDTMIYVFGHEAAPAQSRPCVQDVPKGDRRKMISPRVGPRHRRQPERTIRSELDRWKLLLLLLALPVLIVLMASFMPKGHTAQGAQAAMMALPQAASGVTTTPPAAPALPTATRSADAAAPLAAVPDATPLPTASPVPTGEPVEQRPVSNAAVATPTPLATRPKPAPKPTASESPTGSSIGARALRFAKTMSGGSYAWGKEDPVAKQFDCSGLVQWAFRQAGVTLPRTAAAQAQAMTGARIYDPKALRPGDVVFYYSPISHVGIYAGNSEMLEANQPGTPIGAHPFYTAGFQYAVRPG